MLELLLTSFPAVIRYVQLRRRGDRITLWNMKEALLAWLILAFLLFVAIFYFHPKSYTGLLPFRTVSVVAQTNGPVTELAVSNGQRVETGDLLFRIESSGQEAAVRQARAQLNTLAAAETKAADTLAVAQAGLVQAQAALRLSEIDLGNARTLRDRGSGSADAVRQLEAATAQAQAAVDAAEAQVDLARSDLDITIPAQIEAAQASLQQAEVALAKTEVRAFAGGTVTQLAMSVGSPASQLILSPAMVIIPDRDPDAPMRLVAGFSQVAYGTLYDGMPAEIVCDSNVKLSFRDTVIPAHVVSVQPAVASGQVVPGGQLRELNATGPRGSLLVYLELIHPEQEDVMLAGSGCTVQTYTYNLPGAFGHVISITGIVKAVGLRLKVWGALLAGIGLTGGSSAH